MTPEEISQPVHCPRCGQKAAHTVRNAQHIWNCPLQPRGHGIVKQAPFTDEELLELAEQQANHASTAKLTVEAERAAAGLTAVQGEVGFKLDLATSRDTRTGQQKAEAVIALVNSPEFREWIKDEDNKSIFSNAVSVSAEPQGPNEEKTDGATGDQSDAGDGAEATAANQTPAATATAKVPKAPKNPTKAVKDTAIPVEGPVS